MSVTPCPTPSAPAYGVVVFVPATFKAAFPSFATVADAALNLSFTLATLQLNNSCGSKVKDATLREMLLNLLTAHITALKDGENGTPPAGIVGYVNSAAEGSDRVAASMGTVVYGQAYYLQSQWGLLYWQSTARFRTMRYVPAPPVCADYGNGLGGSLWGGAPGLPPGQQGGGNPFDGGCGC